MRAIQVENSCVLIVDDSPLNRKVLAHILTEQGYQIREAGDGKDAFRLMEEVPPDLVLLDINLPDINGIDVCRRMKDDPSTSDIPVIFISALQETAQKVKAFEAGGIDYVTKPFYKEEVAARVKSQLTIRQLQKELQRHIAELETLYRDVKDLSIRDSLTGLYNRRYFDEVIHTQDAACTRYGTVYTLLMTDLDHFKKINDSLGHKAGDLVLRRFSEILLRSLRDCDTPFRIGGEEFVVLLPETTQGEALIVAQRIMANVRRAPWAEISPDLKLTCSIGSATSKNSCPDEENALLSEADVRLYQAKKAGRDRIATEAGILTF